MKEYSGYKASDISWIGEIPEHWEVKRLKQVLSSPLQYGANERGISYQESLPRYIRITDILDNSLRDNIEKQSLTEQQADGYILQHNDILFARSGGTVGKSFIFNGKYGRCAFAGYLIKARVNDLMVAKFVYFFTQTTCYDEWKKQIFIQSTIQNIGADRYSQLQLPIPPLSEQQHIVSFLDEKTAKIDEYIDKKNKEIEALKEWKKALIAHVVTKGLNTNAKMKDSGVSWIGEIPEHWKVDKLGMHFRQRNEKVSDKEFPALSVSKEGVTPQLSTAVKTDNGDNRKKVCKGDFVVNSRSDRKGSCGFSSYDGSVSLINIVVTPIDLCDRYYHYLFRSNNYIEEFYRLGRGIVADLWTTRYVEMRNIMIPLPPIEEQQEIVEYIDAATTKADKMIVELTNHVESMKEYKQRLIADVVTGKINVQP